MAGETSDSPDTSAELVAWTGQQPAAGRLGPGAAIELLPGDHTQDPFTRLAAAFLVGYRTHSARGYLTDLKAWALWCQRLAVHPFDARRHHVDAWVRTLESEPFGPDRPADGRGVDRPPTVRGLPVLRLRHRRRRPHLLPRRQRPPTPRLRRLLHHRPQPRRTDQTPRRRRTRLGPVRCTDRPARLQRTPHRRSPVSQHRRLQLPTRPPDPPDHAQRWQSLHRTPRRPRRPSPRPLPPGTPLPDDSPTRPLFANPAGGRLVYITAYQTVRRLAEKAGIPAASSITPHSLRHTFVTEALAAGAPLQDVQDAAGHADPRTTRRYDRTRKNHDNHPTFKLVGHLRRDAAAPERREGS